MKYLIARDVAQEPQTVKILVMSGEDITDVSWRIEGKTGPLAYTWRSLARANGIIDPMQYADERGRVIYGTKLDAGIILNPVE